MSIRLPNLSELPGAPDLALQTQPAGIDLSVESVASFAGTGALDFSNVRRSLPDLTPLEWSSDDAAGDESYTSLSPGAYLITYNEQIAVPLDSAGLIVPRSSLMRCGATLCSALWDPGYVGRGQGLLLVNAPLRLYRNARVGQFILFSLEEIVRTGYSGQYQGENL